MVGVVWSEGLIKLGFFFLIGSVSWFLARSIGPFSKLWWPDGPQRRLPPVGAISFGAGILLLVIGGLLAH
jgi:hypothetical protein